MPNSGHISFEWITPILIGIIGFMIRSYLSSIDKKIEEVSSKLEKHMERAEKFIDSFNEKHAVLDKRVSIIETKCFIENEHR